MNPNTTKEFIKTIQMLERTKVYTSLAVKALDEGKHEIYKFIIDNIDAANLPPALVEEKLEDETKLQNRFKN